MCLSRILKAEGEHSLEGRSVKKHGVLAPVGIWKGQEKDGGETKGRNKAGEVVSQART